MNISNFLKAKILKLITNKKSKDFDIKLSSKVLMLRYDRIGDMIITTPVFRELKRVYPNMEISVIASASNYTVLDNNPFIDKVYINNKNNIFFDLPILFKLRKEKIDTCFEFDHSVVSHAILRLLIINPKKIISVKKDGRYGLSGDELKMYDFYTEKKENTHFRDIWLETLNPFGIKPRRKNFEIYCDSTDEDKAHNFVKKFSGKFLLGINLEGAVKGKKIKDNQLRVICSELFSLNKNIQIIILSSPDKDSIIQEKIIKMNFNYVQKSFKTDTINSAAALVKRLDLVITPDTSISHIASTFNKPVITIHEENYNSYKLFGPTSDLNRTIFSKSSKSLEGFSSEDLIDAAKDLFKMI